MINSLPVPDDYAARVAAEVAARYGVQCKPEAVQIVERGVTAQAQWVWDGKALVPVVPVEHVPGAHIRAAMNAKWNTLARQKRLEAAKRREAAETGPAAVGSNTAPALAAIRAAADEKAEKVRAFAAPGKTMAQIAAFMGVTVSGAAKYCRLKGIAYVPVVAHLKANAARKAAGAKRQAEVIELAKTMTVDEIAAHYQITRKAAHARLAKAGVKPQPRAVKHPERSKAAKAERAIKPSGPRNDPRIHAVNARRAEVAAMVARGMGSPEIARHFGVNIRVIQKDRRKMGVPPERAVAKPRQAREGLAAIRARRSERDVNIREMRAQGMTLAAIAQALGCGTATVMNAASRMGLSMQGIRGHVGDPAMAARVLAMVSQGMRRCDIAEALGVARSTVQRIKALAETREAA